MSAMALNLKRMAKAIFSAIYMDKMWAENMISQPIFYLCQQVQEFSQIGLQALAWEKSASKVVSRIGPVDKIHPKTPTLWYN